MESTIIQSLEISHDKHAYGPCTREPVPHISINCLKVSSQPPMQPDFHVKKIQHSLRRQFDKLHYMKIIHITNKQHTTICEIHICTCKYEEYIHICVYIYSYMRIK